MSKEGWHRPATVRSPCLLAGIVDQPVHLFRRLCHQSCQAASLW